MTSLRKTLMVWLMVTTLLILMLSVVFAITVLFDNIEFVQKNIIAFCSLYLILSIAICSLCSYWLSNLVLNPVRDFSTYIKSIRNGNIHSVKLQKLVTAFDEINELYNELYLFIEYTSQQDIQHDMAEKSIKRYEMQYREIAECLPQSLFETDDKGMFTYVNKKWQETFGYDKRAIKEKELSILDILISNDNDQIINGTALFGAEMTGKCSDGSVFPVVLYSSYIYKNTSIQGIRGIIIDNTEHERNIHELQVAKEKAEQSDRLKSAFLANMSHELRTPMNAILGFSELLNEPELTHETRKEYIKHVHNSGNHLLKLIDDIIDLARIEAGEIKISKEGCYINQVLSELEGTFQQLINTQKKSISIKTNLGETDISFAIVTDSFRFKQIMLNLLNNALKFTSNGYIEFGYSVWRNYLQFYVKDTGIGIPKDMHAAIFDRFRQVELGNKREYGGAGLGLSITKSLVQILGGTIWVNSKPGKGSTFYFTLPLEIAVLNKEIQALPSSKHYKNEFSGCTILIAEDESANYSLLTEMLKDTGIRMIWARNGKDAIQICTRNNNIDIILMDIEMPVLNGYDATRLIRRIRPGVPVIAQTAHAMEADKLCCIDAGCNDYIAKPIQMDNLLSVIQKHLQKSIKKVDYELSN